MADQNKKQYIKYEETTYILEDSRLPDPTGFDNKVLGVDNGAYVIRDEQGGGGGTGTVKSVNNVQPDANGNVNLSASDVHALPDNTVIPAAVTERTVAGWGFTKNTGTYVKPSGGIPASDLAADVQTSLDKADTALQSHQSLSGYATEQWVENKGYLTQHQDISGKADKIPRIAKAASDTTATIDPNKLYVFPEMASLTITLAAITDNTIVNEYHFIFESGATATTTTFPAIPGLDDFAAEADTVYEVSILEGRALVTSWEVSA